MIRPIDSMPFLYCQKLEIYIITLYFNFLNILETPEEVLYKFNEKCSAFFINVSNFI